MEDINVNISIMKGDKIFNENTPFVINIFVPESKNLKIRSYADLICVIDISGSMAGAKIDLVKKSLKALVNKMEKTDRICIILFNNSAKNFFNLEYLTDEIKNKLYNIIDNIKPEGGTNIMSGLEKAVEVLINDKDKEKPNRASSIIFLSDGVDNNFNDFELAQKLRDLTKNKDLNFTLNSFGYGGDHDPQTMKKLSNIRDGKYFYIDEYEKVADCFGFVLGTCTSVISNKASLIVELLNKKCEIIKIFGGEYLYDYNKELNYFSTTMLQFIYGKEFTYVLEFQLKINEVKEGEDLILVDFMYQDNEKNFRKKSVTYKYTLNDVNKCKANNEYVRSQVYETIDQSLDLKHNSQNEEAKIVLNEMKDWLVDNKQIYQDSSSDNLFLNDIDLALMCYGNANNNKNNNSIINNIENYDIENDSDNYNDIEAKFEAKFKTKSEPKPETKHEIRDLDKIESTITYRVMSNIKKTSLDPKDGYTTWRQDYYSSSTRRCLVKFENKYSSNNYKKKNKKNCVIF